MLDLAGGNSMVRREPTETLICTPSKSSMNDADDSTLTVEADLNSTCKGTALSAPNSEQSTGKDDPQVPGWTKRYMCSTLRM